MSKFLQVSIVLLTGVYIGATQDDVAKLNEAVHKILLPVMKEIKDDLNSVKKDLSSFNKTISHLNKTVSDLSGDLEDYKQQTASQLSSVHNTHTQQIAQLQALSLNMVTLNSNLDSVDNSSILIMEDLSCIKEDLSSLNETMNRISDDVEEHDNHTTTELMKLNEYLQPNTDTQPMDTCGSIGGWRRVIYLDFTDPNTPCPSGWQLTGYSRRTCGKVSIGSLTCDPVTFPVSGGDYTRVCGRIKAYQYSWTDAFEAYDDGDVDNIDGAYVSGISLTHGSPRQHIWTFAAGSSEALPTADDACPCDATINITIPPFVDGDYFCESGVNSGQATTQLYPYDPLWDGQNCTASSTCCSFNSPPYFTKQLLSPTTDDIEARICWLTDNDDIPIEIIELYVQ